MTPHPMFEGASGLALLSLALFVALSIACAVYDLRYRLIPYHLTGPLVALGVLLAVWAPGPAWPHLLVAVIVVVAGAALFLVRDRASNPLLGDGDVMVLGAYGALLGPNVVVMVGVGAALGVIAQAMRSELAYRPGYAPFGTFLVAGGLLALWVRVF